MTIRCSSSYYLLWLLLSYFLLLFLRFIITIIIIIIIMNINIIKVGVYQPELEQSRVVWRARHRAAASGAECVRPVRTASAQAQAALPRSSRDPAGRGGFVVLCAAASAARPLPP